MDCSLPENEEADWVDVACGVGFSQIQAVLACSRCKMKRYSARVVG